MTNWSCRSKSPVAFGYSAERPLEIESTDPKVKAALILMETHTENTLDIPSLAASVGISRRQLERLFTNHAKASPATIYKRVRLERAKLLLKRTNAPPIDIGVEVGFENSSHFSRSFKQAFGKTPTEWRTAAEA
ncbi:helix-turn-helix protein [Mesorhizobium tianshanense]|uniref:Helix-turn-helix protein n=1 Tax=Mesorhizobium tianshanense TaxID=39844 RepID=A0A562N430_9HYPH|nr:helix-turn-helix protein [Mesorhizobium tianshanense]